MALEQDKQRQQDKQNQLNEQQKNTHHLELDSKNQSSIIAMMTTEHYNLQSGRAMTISESNGRSSLFLSTVSTALVALAFVAQIAKLSTEFYVFALILLPSLFFIGLVTFERTVQVSIEDIIYARGINRIRHLYTEIAPQMTEYFVLSYYDDEMSVYGSEGAKLSWWQFFLTMSGMVAVINSVLAGTFLGLLVYRFLTLPLLFSTLIGLIGFAVAVGLFLRYQWTRWGEAQRRLKTLFPRPTGR
ncbi:MAG: hypothetical protein H0U76_02630 [Ktedonobacteraceae bacterium]|nr:hypothetical protein [Ktedonobacteraceae bacterium]